jgi:hypothetical protein
MMTAATLEVLGEVITLIRKRSLNPETFAENYESDNVWRARSSKE